MYNNSMKIAISACLMGDKVRYDGKHQLNKELVDLVKSHEVIRICPEQSSGFLVPRKPMEIINGKLINTDNLDLTEKLMKGCNKCLEMIKDCDMVILKTRSPSCGYGKIYDGTFTNTLIEGNGIFTDLCLKNNIKVYTELDIKELNDLLKENNNEMY